MLMVSENAFHDLADSLDGMFYTQNFSDVGKLPQVRVLCGVCGFLSLLQM